LKGSGTSATIQGDLYVGDDDDAGTLTVDDGAGVTVANNLEIDEGGAVNVTGAGSTLSVGGNLVIDSGSLTVDENSTLAVTGDLIIGDDDAPDSSAGPTPSPANASQSGSVTLNVENAKLRGPCIIGDNAKGGLTIDSNSTVNANKQDVTVGSQKTGNGTLTVYGDNAKLNDIKSLIVGKSGEGAVHIEDHGSVSASSLYDGSNSSSGKGSITVSGAGSSLLVNTNASVGLNASGSLAIQNNAFVGIGKDFVVGGQGQVTVSSNSDVLVGSSPGVGVGFVTIGKGGAVKLDCLDGAYKANTEISGGTLIVERPDAIAAANGISFGGAGTLTLDSAVTLSNTIDGFGSGDTIQLDGVTATKPKYSNGTLTLLNGTAPVETLKVAGSYTTSNFGLTETGANAVVTFKPSKGSAASIQDQIFNSALLSDSLGHHAPEAIVERGSATLDLWSVGHAPGG
jgi:T5SS/PEP-CTERM-associated repeat protein